MAKKRKIEGKSAKKRSAKKKAPKKKRARKKGAKKKRSKKTTGRQGDPFAAATALLDRTDGEPLGLAFLISPERAITAGSTGPPTSAWQRPAEGRNRSR